MSNYFQLYHLPVSFHPDQAQVKASYYELSRQYHPDRFAQQGGEELANALRMAAMNNDAFKTLKNADATMAYVLKMHGMLDDEEKYTLPPAFLMEMMDINEAIGDYEAGSQDALQMATNTLNEQLELWDDATKLLISRFEAGNHDKNNILVQIKDQYFRKKYLLRIKERIDSFAAH